jgi:BNR repeat protein
MKRAALACVVLLAAAANAATMDRAAFGTSAAIDPSGHLWVAYAQPAGKSGQVVLQRSEDGGATWQAPVRVNSAVEPVAAEGENRPKLAFGTAGEIYVTWTSPTSQKFTGDIRFARSLDGGKTWAAPTVVHHDRQLITHRFESLLVDPRGRLWVAWVDKRDLKASIYYSHSDDRGATWSSDTKLADSSCECCRIALASDSEGRVAALWRHVFEPNERDHAFAFLGGQKATIERATVDRWRVDACPHHGPSLAFGPDGTRHAVWFDQVDGQGRAFYGQLAKNGPTNVRTLPAGATHADVAVAGRTVAVAWKRFDGSVTKIETLVSNDEGRSFAPGPSLQTAGDSDQPRLVTAKQRILVVWRNAGGIAVRDLAAPAPDTRVKPFGRDTLAVIERQYAHSPFWLVLWDLECPYCMKSLAHLAAAQRADPQLKVVTISTDPMQSADQIAARLAQLGVRSDAYAFGDAPREALQYAIDATWLGEKPRAYRYDSDGKRAAISGVIQLPTPPHRNP